VRSATGSKRVFVWKNFKQVNKPSNVSGTAKLTSCESPGAEEVFEPPSVYSLAKRDLFDFLRLEALYVQAVESGLIKHTRKMPTYWVAAALTARVDPSRPLRTFSSIVVGKCWNVIPDEHLFWARYLINYHRRKNKALYNLPDRSHC
jgi:hypothetical protein